ncbi:MAG: AAA family ATPase, partial [Planctomycetota bacterium]
MSVSTKISSSFATPESPWLGLRSFSEDAQSFFFGRSAELDDLYERILDKPLAVLFGQSGLGKSSLLQAALAPRLRATGFLPVLIRFDHDASAPPLEYQLLESLRVALVSAGNEQHAATLFAALAEGKTPLDCAAFLWLLFHDPAYGFIPTRAAPSAEFPRPVFLIDQFEEIFTLGERPARRSASAAFRESLAALVENRPPAALRAMLEDDDDLAERLDYRAQHTRVLVSLREDFLHLLERWRRLMPSLMENRFELRMLSGPQAFLAVVRPGQLRSGMPAIIPNEVGEAIVRFVAGTSDDLPLEEIDAVPPLLSLVCAELNAQRLASGEVQITQAQFEGHSTDILASFYLRSFEVATYGSVLEGIPHAETALKNLRCLIEDRLLSADGFRESIAFDTIARDLAVTT